jgi:hypothetical protein
MGVGGWVGLVLPAVESPNVGIVCEIFGCSVLERPRSAAVGSLILGRYQVFQ